MQIVIDIPDDDYRKAQDGRASVAMMRKAIANGTPHETVTEFADRCRECGREKVLDKIKAEIDLQEKWLLHVGYTACNVDIALYAIKSVVEQYRK